MTVLHRLRPGHRDQVTGEYETLCGLRGLRDLSARRFPVYEYLWQRARERYGSAEGEFYEAMHVRGISCPGCLEKMSEDDGKVGGS